MVYIPTGKELIDPFRFLEEAGIRSGMKVADFGCGTLGHYVFPASHMVGPNGKVYAVDILKSVLDGIRSRIKMENAQNVETVWGDIERPNGVNIRAGSVDLIILANNLFMSKSRPAMFREVVRILKPGGRLAIAEWKTSGMTIGPTSTTAVAPEVAIREVESETLKLEKTFEPGKYHYGLLFRKI